MDILMVEDDLPIALIEGFAHERMVVLPRPLVGEALRKPVTRRILVTDAGVFPNALHHQRSRRSGAEETILIICTTGTGWIAVDGARQRVGAGAVIVIPSGTPHSYGSSDSSPWTIWWCHLRGTDLPELIEAIEISRERPVVQLRSVERCVALVEEIISGLERDSSPPRLLAASGAAWKLLTQIAFDRLTPEQGDPLQRAMTYLRERLDGQITVGELARMVGISPSRLSELFRGATGGGVLAYQTELRMSRARQLLDGTQLPISLVAAEVGYHDPLYFSRQFRRVHGLSPSEYRSHRKG